MVKQSIHLFFFCILCSWMVLNFYTLKSIAFAQSKTAENYFEVLYNNFNGLPTSEANDIAQTADGCIWIASYSSLVRYDGKTFTCFSETHGITSILTLFVDSQDRLWIGTNNDGVILYENNSFKFFTDNKNIPSFSVRSINQLANGDILVGTALGLYTISPDFQIEVVTDHRLKDSFISILEPIDKNSTIGITKVGDIFILEGTQVVEFIAVDQWEYDLALSVISLADEKGQYFLIGTNNNYIVQMRSSDRNSSAFTYQVIETGSLKYINDLFLDSQDRIWIGADSGVGYINQHNDLYILDYLSMGQSIENIIEDFEGNYWLASAKVGVLKLNPSMFKNISSNLSDVVQFNGVELLDGYIYVASSSGIDIIKQSDLSVIENELTQKYRGGYVRCVQKDGDGNLWFSTYTDDALVKYDPRTEEITAFNESKGIDYSRIRSTMTASDGKIWVASGNGIYVIEQDEVIAYYGSDAGFQSLEILSLSEDLEGRVYASTDGAGVYVIEDMEVTQRINRESGLLSDIILRTETDPFNGGTWIVTGNSIAFYDVNTKEVKTINDLPYKNNFDFLFYEDQVIILCSNGIYFVDYESLLSDEIELSYLHKNHLNGLYSAAVANSFSKVDNGVLYFCGYQNLTAYNLNDEAMESFYIPPVELNSILVNEEELYAAKENYFLLPKDANYIQLNIFIPTYALVDYEVSYSLIGYDEFMHTAAYADYVNPTYTNLRGGKYEFLIQLKNNRTNEIINESLFMIEKEYTLLEHPISQVIMIILLITLFTLLVLLIIKKREKENKRKQDQLNGMFHDTVEVLSQVIDAKDCYTNGHSKRVAFYTKIIAQALSLTEDEIDSAYITGLLHDVGKISIPDSVLNKVGRLDKEEYEMMKTHAEKGSNILQNIRAKPELVVGAKYHHERYDGTGYAHGLKEKDIPLIARIIGVADAFDAMYSSRVYRKKLELDVVLNELEVNSGTQFDPEIVNIFIQIIKSGDIDEQLKEFTKEDDMSDYSLI